MADNDHWLGLAVGGSSSASAAQQDDGNWTTYTDTAGREYVHNAVTGDWHYVDDWQVSPQPQATFSSPRQRIRPRPDLVQRSVAPPSVPSKATRKNIRVVHADSVSSASSMLEASSPAPQQLVPYDSTDSGQPTSESRDTWLERIHRLRSENRMAMDQLALRHEHEITALQAKHESELRSLRAEHRYDFQELEHNHSLESQRLQSQLERLTDQNQMLQRERDQLGEHAAQQREQLVNQHERELASLQERHRLELSSAARDALNSSGAGSLVDTPRGDMEDANAKLQEDVRRLQTKLQDATEKHVEALDTARRSIYDEAREERRQLEARFSTQLEAQRRELDSIRKEYSQERQVLVDQISQERAEKQQKYLEGKVDGAAEAKQQHSEAEAKLLEREQGEQQKRLELIKTAHAMEIEKTKQAWENKVLMAESQLEQLRAMSSAQSAELAKSLEARIQTLMDEKKSAEERMLAARAESDKLNAQLEAQAQTILRRSASADSEQQAIRAEVERLRRREKELKDQLEEAEKRAAQAVTTQDESKLVEANQAWQARLQKALAEAAEERKAALEDARRLAAEDKAAALAELRNEFEQAQRLAVAQAVAREKAQVRSRVEALQNAVDDKVQREVQKALEQSKREWEARAALLEADKQEAVSAWKREAAARRKAHNQVVDLQGSIRVFCRIRPIVDLEKAAGGAIDIIRYPDEDALDIRTLRSSASPERLMEAHRNGELGRLLKPADRFDFDRVYTPASRQEEVFEDVDPLILSVLDGYNLCIFAYGQTGSGKTHTMEGPSSDPGVNIRAISRLFEVQAEQRSQSLIKDCIITVSVFEIYNERVRDLLSDASPDGSRSDLAIHQDRAGNTVVEGAEVLTVTSTREVQAAMARAGKARAVGAHDVNEHSSRSHLLVQVTVRVDREDGRASHSKLNLIDLAGSERVGKTAASGQRLKEAQHINKSLSALGDVMNALASKQKHVPFRNSKLTFLLQDSLSGDAKVMMFVNCSPVLWNAPESLCSLRFAARCRQVKLGQAKKQIESGDTAALKRQIAQLQAEVASLRRG